MSMDAELLKQLKQQATVPVPQNYLNSDGKVVKTVYEYQVDLALFATLVVRNCLQICQELGNPLSLTHATPAHVEAAIRSHFGVNPEGLGSLDTHTREEI